MDKLIYSILVAFAIAVLQGPLVISFLRRLKFGQNIREEGPKSHQVKQGVPTMGGIIFISTTIITLFVILKKPDSHSLVALFALVGFGAIGFIDDMLKIVFKQNEGLKPFQKMVLLLIVSGILSYYSAVKIGTDLYIPFLNITWDIGIFYVPFIIIYFAGTTNAVNLTDGLDGLASSVTLLVMTFFALISLAWGEHDLTIFCGILAGGLLGFLRYNSYKAKVFMGDTGSLALGGAVGAVAMILKLPLLVILVGGIYVAEAVSVILQVTYYKKTKKRIFKMAPLHHHFEESGWHESKIVAVFSIITVVLCLIGFLSLSLIYNINF